MERHPRYDILFEPVRIGPVTAPNRFYQVPHCNGTGDADPAAVAAMRAMKAEGGWGVVCTENTEISPSTEIAPYPSLHLWSDADVAIQAPMVEAVHRHGALAGVELAHMGLYAPNRSSRLPTLGPSSHPTLDGIEPFQARAMDLADIRRLRAEHRAAALRARRAGFDIVYVYASHNMALASHFLSRRYNQRSDAYGGPLENRCRLLRELLEDTKEAVGDRCAVALRFAVDDRTGTMGHSWDGEGREVVELLKDIPDLWDVNLADWSHDSMSSRFAKEGFQEPFTRFVKTVTGKPVVGVGRFTSPDTMVAQVRRGSLDFIGAARPSIADPFLPAKIRDGRAEDIRECIGCNVCLSGENSFAPMRCTQNPTMMEEGRRGWHPERVPPRGSADRILVVGGGPAGLECALTLGRRGYEVALAEARDEFGGRVSRESRLPGLAEWSRVRDYRLGQLARLPNVELYRGSPLDAAAALEHGAAQVVVATGARWRRDGIGRPDPDPVPSDAEALVLTPDDVMDGRLPGGHVVVYDTDGGYLGNVLAERLRAAGTAVTIVTPAAETAAFLALTLEQGHVLRQLTRLGVAIVRQRRLAAIRADHVELACVHGGRATRLDANAVLLVTQRVPDDALYQALAADPAALAAHGVRGLHRIGDCEAPHLIAGAVYAGHRLGRALDASPTPPRPHPAR